MTFLGIGAQFNQWYLHILIRNMLGLEPTYSHSRSNAMSLFPGFKIYLSQEKSGYFKMTFIYFNYSEIIFGPLRENLHCHSHSHLVFTTAKHVLVNWIYIINIVFYLILTTKTETNFLANPICTLSYLYR